MKKISNIIVIAFVVMCMVTVSPGIQVFASNTMQTEFDEENIILRFGVVSDIHQNGLWSGKLSAPPAQEWSHAIDVFQQLAKDDGATLDAILINGDMTDGLSNRGSNIGSFNGYGDRALQAMREVSFFAHGVWGSDNSVTFSQTKKVPNKESTAPNGYIQATSVSGFGNGFDDTTALFYVLGNHDEIGRGAGGAFTKTVDGKSINFSDIHSADYFAAILCGWHHNPDTDEAKTNSIGGTGSYQDGVEHSYKDYIADLVDYNTNPKTEVTADSFESKFAVKLTTADALFDKYLGHLDTQTTLADAQNGLHYGNMHMTIDPDGVKDDDYTDDIHFIGVEMSQSEESVAWAKAILDKSVAENPAKPIFMMTHYKMPGNMFGSMNVTNLHNVIKNYPQVIIWGAHSHTTMHNDTAINSDNGYIQVETATTRYLDTKNQLTLSSKFGDAVNQNENYPNTPYNYSYHTSENSYGMYVEMDKNYNVRLNRLDLYRSYSKDYQERESFFVNDRYTNFDNQKYNEEFVAVDEPVFIREPWDIVDIKSGAHLEKFSSETRANNTSKPYFENNNSLAAVGTDDGLEVTFTMNAKDDGMVMLYVLEVKKANGSVVHRRYYTNLYFEYPQDPNATYPGNNIAEREIVANIDGLDSGRSYTVSLFAVDDFEVAGTPLTVKATTGGASSDDMPFYDGSYMLEYKDAKGKTKTKLIIEGVSQIPESRINLILLGNDTDKFQGSNIGYVNQTNTNENGEWNFVFEIEGALSDYTLLLRQDGAVKDNIRIEKISSVTDALDIEMTTKIVESNLKNTVTIKNPMLLETDFDLIVAMYDENHNLVKALDPQKISLNANEKTVYEEVENAFASGAAYAKVFLWYDGVTPLIPSQRADALK